MATLRFSATLSIYITLGWRKQLCAAISQKFTICIDHDIDRRHRLWFRNRDPTFAASTISRGESGTTRLRCRIRVRVRLGLAVFRTFTYLGQGIGFQAVPVTAGGYTVTVLLYYF